MELFEEIIPPIKFCKFYTTYCRVCQDHTPAGGVKTQDGHVITRIWYAGEPYGITQCRKCGTIYVSTYTQKVKKVDKKHLIEELLRQIGRHGGIKKEVNDEAENH